MAYRKNSQTDGPSAEARALEQFASLMIEKIETLQTDWQKPWFTESMMVWPRNLSGREYNGCNALMLALHCEKEGYKLPVFATFNRILGLNYTTDKQGNRKQLLDEKGEPLPTVSVQKGEHSFPVLLTTFTVVNKETKEKINYDAYKLLSQKEREKYTVYPKQQVYSVFNVAQSNLKEARPELYAKLEEQSLRKCPFVRQEGEMLSLPAVDQMIERGLWYCPIKPMHQDSAYYSVSKDEIVVPEKSQFVNGESFYSTLFHEATHSTGAESRLNRLKSGAGFGSADYGREELVAELSAALTASRYGIAKEVKDESAAYLKSWLDSIKESPDYLKTVLLDVKKASSMLSQRIDLIQQRIDDYQENIGRKDVYSDIYDLDFDGNVSEAIHEEVNKPEVAEVAEEASRYGMRR